MGANRGRGQVNPTGDKSNNTLYSSPVAGQITKIEKQKTGYDISIKSKSGDIVSVKIPAGPDLVVKQGQALAADQALTIDPNVGGFGQAETEIVLQDPARIYGYLAFVVSIIVAQTMFVIKKKQFEKVQIAEADF